MGFAIKIYQNHVLSNYHGLKIIGYYCQSINVITRKKLERQIVVVDGKNKDEIEIFPTLVDAEKVLDTLKETNKKYVFKIIEYPEGNTNNSQEVNNEEYDDGDRDRS